MLKEAIDRNNNSTINTNGTDDKPAKITYELKKAEDLTDKVATFDRAYCHQGVQFFEDRKKALDNIWRSLKPGAHFQCAIWAPVKGQLLFEVMRDCLIECGREEWVPVLLKPFSFAGGKSRVESVDLLERVLIDAKFENVDVVFEEGDVTFATLDEALKVISVAPFGKELVENKELYEKFTRKFKSKMLSANMDGDYNINAKAKSGTVNADECTFKMMSFFAHCNKPWAGVNNSSFKC